jgi:hypothetical protein
MIAQVLLRFSKKDQFACPRKSLAIQRFGAGVASSEVPPRAAECGEQCDSVLVSHGDRLYLSDVRSGTASAQWARYEKAETRGGNSGQRNCCARGKYVREFDSSPVGSEPSRRQVLK